MSLKKDYIPLNIEKDSSLAITFGNSAHNANELEKAIKNFLVNHVKELNEYLISQKMAPLPEQGAAMYGASAKVMTHQTDGWCCGHLQTRIVFEFLSDSPINARHQPPQESSALKEESIDSPLNQIRQMQVKDHETSS